jgi:hypothetical protein
MCRRQWPSAVPIKTPLFFTVAPERQYTFVRPRSNNMTVGKVLFGCPPARQRGYLHQGEGHPPTVAKPTRDSVYPCRADALQAGYTETHGEESACRFGKLYSITMKVMQWLREQFQYNHKEVTVSGTVSIHRVPIPLPRRGGAKRRGGLYGIDVPSPLQIASARPPF